MEEDHFEKLPPEDRCGHKSWKARISGYSSLMLLFDDISDPDSDDWNKYVPTVGSILQENNDPALEKGLEVVLNFVTKAAAATKIVGPTVTGLVKKCVASSRVRTRDLASQICLTFIEIGKQKNVIDELLKGAQSKNPKISVGCIHILTEIIVNFGTTVIPVEGVFLKLPVLLEDKDQNVRNEAKSLTIQLYRWLGDDLRANLLKPEFLKPQKLAEIVTDIAKIKDRSAFPLRVLRLQRKSERVDITQRDDISCMTTGTSEIAESSEISAVFDVIVPVDIISQIPQEFHTQVVSSKWLERKAALENLEKLLCNAGKIQNSDFHEIIKTLVDIISKDSNISVVCMAVKCVKLFANKLNGGFTQYSSVVFKALLEKLKERKMSVVQTLREALDSIFTSSSFDSLVDGLSENLRNKNPHVKSEAALFLSKCFPRLSPTSMNKKSLKPIFSALARCMSDQDPSVREGSAKALGVAMGILGENGVSHLFKDLDKTKLSKIKEYAELFLVETNRTKLGVSYSEKQKVTPNSDSYPKCSSETTGEKINENNFAEFSKKGKVYNVKLKTADKSRKSINEVISRETMTALSSKDWSLRLGAILELQKIVNSELNISPSLGELGPLLNSRMLDINPKISTASINLVTSLAEKIGLPFRDQLQTVLPSLLRAVSDVKGPVRDAAVGGLTKIGENCGFGEIFKSECLAECLTSGSNTSKSKLWRWLAETLPKTNGKKVSKNELENILQPLFASLEDRSAEVRSEASNAVQGFLKFLTAETIINSSMKFFGKRNNNVTKIILDMNKSGPEAFDTPSEQPDNIKSKSTKAPSPIAPRKKVAFVDEVENPSFLDVNSLKNQRVIDEHKHKTPKWDFVTPRMEFVELLKGLMSAANFGPELTKMMYHTDFRCHVKAMDLLIEEMSKNSVGIICNLDLILRWLTLRFFDGNPTVLSKSLDFVIVTLKHLRETNYCLLDSEAAAFVPYLVMKLGDSKENIQTKVKGILLSLTSVYPVPKLKKFLMDGLRSNIGRQRANCLDVIASYINLYGDTVYIREIDSLSEAVGKLLKDRDPGVKKEAFVVAGMLYDREGEKTMKLLGKHSGEDYRMIEERVRQCVGTKPNWPRKQNEIPDASSFQSETSFSQMMEFPESASQPAPCNGLPDQKQHRNFHWDTNLVQEIDDLANLVIQPSAEIVDRDLEFLKEESTSFGRAFHLSQRERMISPPILRYVESISDGDLITAKNSMKYVDMILNTGRRDDLLNYADILVQNLVLSLRNLEGEPCCEVLENYGLTFTLLITLCNEKGFIEQFSEERLYETLEQLLSIISDYKFKGKEFEIYLKTVNTIILKILENSRKTPLFSSLLKMLSDTHAEGTKASVKLNELCMKCLWKLNRTQVTWDSELDYSTIFSIMRETIKRLPTPWWKARPGDLSVRTIKTVLLTMVKLRGARVLDYVGSDDDCQLGRYLTKLVKHLSPKGSADGGTHEDIHTSAHRGNLTPCQANELSEIFSDIALNAPGAMDKLNEFNKRNPLVDLHKILLTMSPAFLKYFLAITRSTEGIRGKPEANPVDDRDFSIDVARMWGKLKSLQEKIDSL